jgi:hypothetical protein
MKRLIISAILTFAATAGAVAQGWVLLENDAGEGNVSFYSANGPLAQPGTYQVALEWWNGSAFVQEGAVYQSSATNGDGPGFFHGERVTVPTYSAEGTFIVQAWTGNYANYAAAIAGGTNVFAGQTAPFTNSEGSPSLIPPSPPVGLSGVRGSGWDGNIILVQQSAGPLTITNQPQSALVNAYDTTSFSVGVTGAPPISYQWSFNGTNMDGATSSILTISNATQANLGTYAVLVTNAASMTNSSNAVLSMPPFLAVPFMGATNHLGATNTLSVGAWGTEPLSYQWFFNGSPISNATNQQFTLANIQFTNAGLYSVTVTSPLGSVTNAPELVVVNVAGIGMVFSPTVTIAGNVGDTFEIQRTSDLSDPNSWVTMTNLTLNATVQLWADTNLNASLPGNPHPFYRILPGQ